MNTCLTGKQLRGFGAETLVKFKGKVPVVRIVKQDPRPGQWFGITL